ncbi:type 1 glutamine amidotransferase domain-containing protein [Algoriphagus sp.]|uniref:type 1 glutamine amidotransferase domain-containing protein n=1 Tax=Algoriphagus sp. TaxID=1872435 RepID=UPI002632D03F|nr:type 1 glutamine amidotransferase domain-containing protein [Algoriphagus sp.]
MNNSTENIALLTETGFEEIELTSPKKALGDAGFQVDLISPQSKIKSWKNGNWNLEMDVNKLVTDADPNDYDGLLIPGGVLNPDKLRRNDEAIGFINQFFDAGKPIASICHGPQVLIETGALQGRRMTSFPSIKTDLKNAGVRWENREVVTDQGLVTSRDPNDLEAFNKKMIEEFQEGVHNRQKTI